MIYIIVASENIFNEFVKDKNYNLIYRNEIDLLHPNERFEKAKQLVKQDNLCINTYSDKFIESMEVLSVAIDKEIKFFYSDDLVEVTYSDIRKLYSHLGDVYDELNRIRLRNEMGLNYEF